DSFVRPSKGFFSSLSVDISRGLENSLDNFFRYSFDLRYYVSPVERVTLAWLGRVGYIDPYGSRTTIPEDQLFYLGGTLDVRGFDENTLRLDSLGSPAGGRYILVSSVEARIELRYKFELTCFFDTGSVRKPAIENISEDFRSSVGAGLRYITPIGPIGFLYGYKLDREPSESPGRFHFSVGYTF
ncbi:MAG: BamA/TamA family outer membrane protein, partial [Desulfomonilia bacterium]|nr:BamA/TamA family outer membrane protein [Desulfomonilia bacterium]